MSVLLVTCTNVVKPADHMIKTNPCFTWFWKSCGLFRLWLWSANSDNVCDFSCDSKLLFSVMLFPWLHTLDEVIDETYGVAVQFDEEEEEVISKKNFLMWK